MVTSIIGWWTIRASSHVTCRNGYLYYQWINVLKLNLNSRWRIFHSTYTNEGIIAQSRLAICGRSTQLTEFSFKVNCLWTAKYFPKSRLLKRRCDQALNRLLCQVRVIFATSKFFVRAFFQLALAIQMVSSSSTFRQCLDQAVLTKKHSWSSYSQPSRKMIRYSIKTFFTKNGKRSYLMNRRIWSPGQIRYPARLIP